MDNYVSMYICRDFAKSKTFMRLLSTRYKRQSRTGNKIQKKFSHVAFEENICVLKISVIKTYRTIVIVYSEECKE